MFDLLLCFPCRVFVFLFRVRLVSPRPHCLVSRVSVSCVHLFSLGLLLACLLPLGVMSSTSSTGLTRFQSGGQKRGGG